MYEEKHTEGGGGDGGKEGGGGDGGSDGGGGGGGGSDGGGGLDGGSAGGDGGEGTGVLVQNTRLSSLVLVPCVVSWVLKYRQ